MNVPELLQLVCALTLVLEDPSQMLLAIHFFYTRHKHKNEVGMAAVAL
jgi:hypothetical protein